MNTSIMEPSKPMIVKLSDQITTADQPDVFALGGFHHLLVIINHISLSKANIAPSNIGNSAAAEHPGRIVIGPGSVAMK